MGDRANAVAALRAGIRLYNDGAFFEAHEVLEEAWRQMARGSPERRFFQALIHLAAAAIHHRDHHPRPAWLQYGRALDKLCDLPPLYYGMEVVRLRDLAARERRGLAGGLATPPPAVRWSVDLAAGTGDDPTQ